MKYSYIKEKFNQELTIINKIINDNISSEIKIIEKVCNYSINSGGGGKK